jgi:hypothetical protein
VVYRQEELPGMRVEQRPQYKGGLRISQPQHLALRPDLGLMCHPRLAAMVLCMRVCGQRAVIHVRAGRFAVVFSDPKHSVALGKFERPLRGVSGRRREGTLEVGRL